MTSQPAAADDTALLTTALNHYWAVHDARYNRALQVTNFYIVSIAIVFTGYTSAINGKHYGAAAVLNLGGLGLTALTAAVVLGAVNAAAQAEPVLTELETRMARRLRIDSIRMAIFPASIRMAIFPTSTTRRRVGIAITFGLAALLQISGLLYALIHSGRR